MTLVILSSHPECATALAEQIRIELAMECVIVDHVAQAIAIKKPRLIIVHPTVTDLPQLSTPVIFVPEERRHMQELLQNIRETLAAQEENPHITLGNNFYLSIRNKELINSSADTTVSLTDKEVQLLTCLVGAGSVGMGREQLLKEVWGIDSVLDTHTLETHIYRLRNKFRDLGVSDAIEGLAGQYCLNMKLI